MYGWNTRTGYWERHLRGLQVGDHCENRRTGKTFVVKEILPWGDDFDCADEDGEKHRYQDCKVTKRVEGGLDWKDICY
jgi:hypothetical protein